MGELSQKLRILRLRFRRTGYILTYTGMQGDKIGNEEWTMVVSCSTDSQRFQYQQ